MVSNTNLVHWEHAAGWPLVDLFDYRFLSFQIARCSSMRRRCCSSDDNLLNVDAARYAGLDAVQVRGVQEAEMALKARRVL
jgi:hypothetical protein